MAPGLGLGAQRKPGDKSGPPRPCPALCLFGEGQVREGEADQSTPFHRLSSPHFSAAGMDLNGGLGGRHENKESNTASVLKVGG